MNENIEISNLIDGIFDIVNNIDTNKNITEEQIITLEKFKNKYSSNLYTSCIINYYKIKINSYGENVKYEIFLNQIIYFIKNIKNKIELLTKDIGLELIINDIILKILYDKIIKINVKSLTEIKESKIIQKINYINKLSLIENEIKLLFFTSDKKNTICTNTNLNLDVTNIFKPIDNLLSGELKEKIKIMDDGLVNSWSTSGSRKYYDVYESYLELMKNMRELNELSKIIDHIIIKDKIINKICWFYNKYLIQINFNESLNNLTNSNEFNKTFVNINTLHRMIDDLDELNINSEIRNKTIISIEEKINIYEKIIFTLISDIIKKIFSPSITDITKDFYDKQTQSKIYAITEKFVKKEAISDKKIALEYFKKTNHIVCKNIRINLLSCIEMYSEQKNNQFIEWYKEIKLELVNQIKENISETEYPQFYFPDSDIVKWIDLIYEETNLIIDYLNLDKKDNKNNKNILIDEVTWEKKFTNIFGHNKEYTQLYKYKLNKINPMNKVIAGGTKIFNSVGNDITNLSYGVVSITKNSINNVNNISSGISNINFFDKKN